MTPRTARFSGSEAAACQGASVWPHPLSLPPAMTGLLASIGIAGRFAARSSGAGVSVL